MMVLFLSFFSAGLALLIAQGTVKASEKAAANKDGETVEVEKTANNQPELDSIKDLESSGPDTSEPETNL